MFELTINGEVYQFKFGMGFMREVDKRIVRTVDGTNGKTKNIGLQYTIAGIIDGEVDTLVDVLDVANKGFNPRVTRDLLDSYIEDESTDIDELFENVLDFLKKANATKKTTKMLLEAIEKEKAKESANANL